MSGSLAALSAFSATGTQGSAVVDSLKNDGDVLSVVYNKNDTTRQLITGTALVECTEQGSGHPNGLNNSTTTYIVNSDVDVIGELYVTIAYEFNVRADESKFDVSDDSNLNDFAYDYRTKFFYTPFIQKVEILVGTQVFQTIYPSDICTGTSLTGQASGYLSSNTGINCAPPPSDGSKIITFRGNMPIRIPTLMDTVLPSLSNFTDQKNNGYIMAAAPHQDMYIKIYWGDGNMNNMPPLYANMNEPDFIDADPLDPINLKLNSARIYMKNTTLSNAERKLVTENPFAKRVTFNQTVFSDRFTVRCGTGNPIGRTSAPVKKVGPNMVDINCDSFNNYSSGLYIYRNQIPIMGGMDDGAGGGLVYDTEPNFTVELLLNGKSFSGEVDIGLLTQTTSLQNVASSIYTNAYGGIYLPLSNNIYGSGVPFNRFDTITVRIKYSWPDSILTNPFSDLDPNWDPPILENVQYSVTSAGETSILYSGGAASITRF